MAITSIEQEYEFIESWQDYRIGTRMIYGGRGASMDIRKAKDNFDKDGKPKCFNCNIYGHMTKGCRKPKKEQDIRKYYKCNKIGHIAKDCRS